MTKHEAIARRKARRSKEQQRMRLLAATQQETRHMAFLRERRA